ncbi:hypothetical protein PK35_09915 [Tamlana nanhaiensis]|uniref:Uncharacterized protein n=1 Tax=Neotamlana nanhaiensis TaxID=1382798 RepID=A0A0D7W1D4_9FLAO|nr:hypothetical protein [Tamlana nanhaiensis]KJD32513.1 hypothetical protein PK35_09915 [Tamlana nanhaiensis]
MRVLFYIITSLFFTQNYAQTNWKKGSLYEKGVVRLKDSTTHEGLIKVKTLGGIKFKQTIDDKAITYESKDIIGYDNLETKEKFLYRTVNDISMLMRIEELGEINLFCVEKSGAVTMQHMHATPTSTPMYNTHYGASKVFYIEKNNITYNIGGKIRGNEWHLFEECPRLIEKLKNGEIEKNAISEIVIMYNKDCNLN